MSAVLNTNVASLWASKNLLGAQTKLATSVERLASGLRINRARDDAAGLGVANSLTAQINGANQGIRNLNDAVSSMQTGEGAIAAAQEMGQRILMLATQGANSTLSSEQRTSIVDEMKKLLIAIDAIGDRTSFSSNKLLSYDASATRKATLYSMQISNTSTDRVSLDSDAFVDVGGTVAMATSGVSSNTVTLASTIAPNVEGRKVYTYDANNNLVYSGFDQQQLDARSGRQSRNESAVDYGCLATGSEVSGCLRTVTDNAARFDGGLSESDGVHPLQLDRAFLELIFRKKPGVGYRLRW
jgi:flagellin